MPHPRAGRFRPGAPPGPAGAARGLAAPRAGRRGCDPAVRGGRARARLRQRARARASGGRARHDRRHRRPGARLRPQLPSHLAADARALGGDRHRDAARAGHAADLALPDRGDAFRTRRPSPGLGLAGARPHGHRRERDRGADPRRGGAGDRARRPAPEGTRAAVLGTGAAAARGAGRDRPHRPVAVRGARRGRRGVGLPDDAAPRRAARPRDRGAQLARGGVPAGGRDAAGDRPDQRVRRPDRRLRAPVHPAGA